ncbi:proteoglycan 4-like [Cydia fagiglandana]|uniref:proteoglycan 4-like n=1 Tax=Cydia fagiglandana TaxID=1458189 RepID=UPI002FEE6111
MYCCICGCGSKSTDRRNNKLAGIRFYSFPAHSSFLPWQSEKRKLWIDAVRRHTFTTASWKLDQRTKWIAAVRSVNTGTDGSPWTPREHDCICSAHFIGGKKKDETASPSYIPTIFSSVRNPVTFKPNRATRLCSAHFVGNKKSENPLNPAYIPTIFSGNKEASPTSPPPAPRHPPSGAPAAPRQPPNRAPPTPRQPPRSAPAAPRQPPRTAPDVAAAPFPEKPKLSEDVPTLCVFPALQVVPIEPFVPKEVDNSCKDCASLAVGFSFWCVQCCRGPLCGACAECAPHDGHYLLRTPKGATHSQTEAVLAVVRQHLQAENLLTLYEINNDGVKVEIKEEPEEPPPSVPEPDPLDPLATHYTATGKQFVEDETANHCLPKRRRIMPAENNATQPNTLVKLEPKTFISQTIVKDTPSSPKTVLKRTPGGLKKVLLKQIPSGSQPVLKLKPIPSDSILKTKLDRLKRSQSVPKATSTTRKSQTVLKIIPNDPRRKTLLQVTPRETQTVNQSSDTKEPQTKTQPGKLKIKRTLLKVPLSELTKSKTLLNHPSGLKTLRKVKPDEILELDKIQKILKGSFQQNDLKGQKLHNVLKGFSTPLKVTSEAPRNSE